MRLRWSPQAASDLERIAAYLDERSPSTSERVIRALYDATETLTHFPRRGRPGGVAGTRELVVSSLGYLIIYEVQAEMVRILRIVHGSQERN